MLWAAKFFLTGTYEITDFGPGMLEYPEYILAFLGAIIDFFAGAVLLLFSWNLLSKKEPEPTQ